MTWYRPNLRRGRPASTIWYRQRASSNQRRGRPASTTSFRQRTSSSPREGLLASTTSYPQRISSKTREGLPASTTSYRLRTGRVASTSTIKCTTNPAPTDNRMIALLFPKGQAKLMIRNLQGPIELFSTTESRLNANSNNSRWRMRMGHMTANLSCQLQPSVKIRVRPFLPSEHRISSSWINPSKILCVLRGRMTTQSAHVGRLTRLA